MAVLKDIDPVGMPPLLNAGALAAIFSSMYPSAFVETSSMLVAHERFASVPGNWLRTFSELVGAATSLAVADHVEGYPYCLSMQFCKDGAAPPQIGGTVAWPLAYTQAIQTSWHVDKLPAAAGAPAIADMPDYVIARQINGGAFEFATLESKARNEPVDTGTYGQFEKFKLQAENASIVAKPGAPPAPVLARKVLSLVAVRPQMKKLRTRVLRCRWANHRVAEGDSAPVSDRDGLRFVVASTAVHLHNAGFRELADALARCLQVGHRPDLQERDQVAEELWRRDPLQFGMHEFTAGWVTTAVGNPRVGDVVMPLEQLALLRMLGAVVAKPDPLRERSAAHALWEARTQQRRPSTLNDVGGFRVEISSTGFGLLSRGE